MLSTCAQVINAGQAKPSPPVGPALGQVSKRRRQRDLPQRWLSPTLTLAHTVFIFWTISGWAQHHGILQGVQREDANVQGVWRNCEQCPVN